MKVITLKDLKGEGFNTKFEYSLDSGVYKGTFELTDLTATDYGEVVVVTGKGKTTVEGKGKEIIRVNVPIDQLDDNIEAVIDLVKKMSTDDAAKKVDSVAEAGVKGAFDELKKKAGLEDGEVVFTDISSSNVKVSADPVISIDVNAGCLVGMVKQSTAAKDVEFLIYFIKKAC